MGLFDWMMKKTPTMTVEEVLRFYREMGFFSDVDLGKRMSRLFSRFRTITVRSMIQRTPGTTYCCCLTTKDECGQAIQSATCVLKTESKLRY